MPQPIVDNPWGIKHRRALALDAYVLTGSTEAAAQLLNTTDRSLMALVSRALDQMPPAPRLHRVLWWRDFRGLVTSPAWPEAAASTTRTFGLTGRQAEVWDAWCAGADEDEMARQFGISRASVKSAIRAGGYKIPGERMGNKQAAWKRARECGN